MKFHAINKTQLDSKCNGNKTIIIFKENNIIKEHFRLIRKINNYFFAKYQIPLEQNEHNVTKYIYDTTLSELF